MLDGLVDEQADVAIVVERGRVHDYERCTAVLRQIDGLARFLCKRFDAVVITTDVGGGADDGCRHDGLLCVYAENKHIIITLSREYGSGGRYIGKLVAEKLGIKLYDKEFVKKVAEETGLSEEFIKNNEQKRDALADLNNGYYFGLNNADELFLKESEIIKNTAEKESCVIVGRCADFILNDRKDVTKVFIYSNMENKVKRATEFYGLDKAKAEKEITRINKLRANHYKHYTEKEWNNPNNYDICINSDTLGVEKSADLICEIVNKKTDQLV